MKITGIYQIQSKIKPERIYIGSSINIKNRWGHHLTELRRNDHENNRLQNHFNKYGEVDLQFSILLNCEIEDLIKIEQYFIDSHNPFFNICKIAGSTRGYRHSEEIKEKMRKPKSEEAKQRMRKPKSAEAKLNISKAKKGRPNGMLGKHLSVCTRLKIKIARNKRGPISEETRNKMKISQKARHLKTA